MENKFDKLLNCIEAADCRDRSFDLCRQFFVANWKEPDLHKEIALNLYAYLASWGMLRNSFLMQMNYLALVPVVDEMCKSENGKYKYESLLSWEPANNDAEDQEAIRLIMEFKKAIKDVFCGKKYYKDYDPDNPKSMSRDNVSDTMVSKMLLGTFGCVPAYDDNLKAGLKKHEICQTLNEASLNRIINHFIKVKGNEDIRRLRQIKPFNEQLYTTMRIVDFILWHEGLN